MAVSECSRGVNENFRHVDFFSVVSFGPSYDAGKARLVLVEEPPSLSLKSSLGGRNTPRGWCSRSASFHHDAIDSLQISVRLSRFTFPSVWTRLR